ncbi:hypothetical protein RHMOL_Rhmol07G0236100 [Rhododendron molle]|uniref:Uncharacterized protein n=1 Tax=Rhododendron molle TaxID=49168 RepID=A0ACC0N4N9_RHOML|nr:hypothetical protein RHMOL_Rhmol07G0236100 [Rhododendron molle]
MGVVEIKIIREHLYAAVCKCFPSHWLHTTNLDTSASTTRIVMAWDPGVLTITLISASSHMVLGKVEGIACHREFFISIIYGSNSVSERRGLWSALRHANSVVRTFAWLQMGDYNVVRKVNERMVGFDSSATLEFNNCLHDLEMDDMPARGFWYTWSNK